MLTRRNIKNTALLKPIKAKAKKKKGVKLASILDEKERQYLVGLKKELQNKHE